MADLLVLINSVGPRQLLASLPQLVPACSQETLLPLHVHVRVKLSAEGVKRGVETTPNDIPSPMAKGHPGPSMSKGLDESFNNDDDCNFLVISTLYILEWS